MLTFSTNVRSEDSIVLSKGAPAPFTGILFSESKEKEIKNQLQEFDVCLQENKSFSRELDLFKKNEGLYTNQIDLLLKQNHNLLNDYNDKVSTDNTMKFVYFGLGIVTTGLAIYGAKQLLTH